MLEAVLDTSILARGLRAGPETAVGFIMGSWTDGLFRVVVSQHILDELQRTLAKSYFLQRVALDEIQDYTRQVARVATLVSITAEVHGVAPSPADDLVLATAVSGHVPYVVTGDHRFQEVGSYQGSRS